VLGLTTTQDHHRYRAGLPALSANVVVSPNNRRPPGVHTNPAPLPDRIAVVTQPVLKSQDPLAIFRP